MKIAIIGSGNVSYHLNRALKSKAAVSLINPHSLQGLPIDADIIMIAVADRAIESVFNNIPKTSACIVHTSGSTPMNVLKGNSPDYGVFYPLQTFSKGIDLIYSEIPLFLEASNKRSLKTIQELAALFSYKIRFADSSMRERLHLASVFVCNFTNAMAGIAYKIVENSGLNFKDLIPLLHQTVDKLDILTPSDAQTGPAVRNDELIINRHLDILENDYPEFRDIYKHISVQIQQNLCKK